MQEVDVPLVEPALVEFLLGREVYRRSEYLALRNDGETALVAVRKASDEPLFSRVVEVRVLAKPDEVVSIHDAGHRCRQRHGPGPPRPRQARQGARAYVVQGRYEHVNFIWEPAPIRVRVTEVVPPEPPKLLDMAAQVVAFDEDLPPVELVLDAVDIRALAAAHPAGRYLLPCRGSGVDLDGEVEFLDTRPKERRELAARRLRTIAAVPPPLLRRRAAPRRHLPRASERRDREQRPDAHEVLPAGARRRVGGPNRGRAVGRQPRRGPERAALAHRCRPARRGRGRVGDRMGAHLVDSTVYGHLWATPELHELFDDRGRFQSWLDILVALAEAQAEVGLSPPTPRAPSGPHADVERLDLARVAAETRATGHSTLGLIHCLQEVLPEDAAEWVYFGATVQDISDTWNALVMRRVGDVLDRDLRRAERAALALGERHRDTILCGRTHGQPGLPMTFGFKAAVWASELRRHRERVAEGRRRWEVVQLGGALGTMEFWGDRALPLLDEFARRLGLAAPDIAWITARDRIAEFLGLLAMVTATLAKIGNEIYELQRPEIGEVSEPFTPGQVGSITMPHKRNPELSEHLGTLARVVRADAGVAVEAMVHEHERDGRAWKAEWVVFPEACLLTGVSLAVAARLLEGLEVHPERMAANLEARGGYVLSEPVLRTLADRMGKHAAHQALYDGDDGRPPTGRRPGGGAPRRPGHHQAPRRGRALPVPRSPAIPRRRPGVRRPGARRGLRRGAMSERPQCSERGPSGPLRSSRSGEK